MNEQYPNSKVAHILYMVLDATNEAREEGRYFTVYRVAFSKQPSFQRNLGPGLR